MLILYRIMLVAMLAAHSSLAFPAHDLEDIAKVARQFIDDSLNETPFSRREIQVRPLDPRLRLADCDQPLEAFMPNSQRSRSTMTIGVRCSGDSPWKVYVSAQVKLFQPVAALTRPVPGKTPLQADDIEFVETDITRLHRGYFLDPSELQGLMTKRALKRGEILTPDNVQTPLAVKKGNKIIIRASGGGIEVTMMGEALRSGGIGERIPVRNQSSGRTIEALIEGPGEVSVVY